jgi:hypothetical protein
MTATVTLGLRELGTRGAPKSQKQQLKLPRRPPICPAGEEVLGKAKGSTVLGAVKFLRRNREEAKRLLSPALHHYLDERIQVSRWYPEEDLLALIRAVAPLIPAGTGNPYEAMGRLNARQHMATVYSHLISESDELALVHRGFVLWQTMHDTGRLTITLERPGRARLDLIDYTQPSHEMCATVTGYISETFIVTGLKDPIVAMISCRVAGDDVCSWRATWRPKEES